MRIIDSADKSFAAARHAYESRSNSHRNLQTTCGNQQRQQMTEIFYYSQLGA